MFELIEEKLKNKEKYSVTEKGAVGYKTSGSKLVDLTYSIASMRKLDEFIIQQRFREAFFEDRDHAIKWLFYIRDIREGLGERRLFKICYKELAFLDNNIFCENLYNIEEFGRWDDILYFLDLKVGKVQPTIKQIIINRLSEDLLNMEYNQPISLLGKWLPSENASSEKTKELAKKIRKMLNISSKQYRLMLSVLRKHLNIVERDICNNNWDNIDYEKVPSLANLKYRNAFLKHDEKRRMSYLDDVKNDKQKMNMETATPVDIVSLYNQRSKNDYDESLELAWKNLKDIYIQDTLVVADGSGSMRLLIDSNYTSALDVANALSIYTAEHNNGVYKNKYITFSNEPRFVEFQDDMSLKEKIRFARQHDEISSTNIKAVFDLILDTAVTNDIEPDEMIKNVLIISDMEFDVAQKEALVRKEDNQELTNSLFEEIRIEYNSKGYKLPKLIFWNVNSRTETVPMTENEMGVILVSGFSQNILKMAMSDQFNPKEALFKILESPRYHNVILH